MFTWIEKADRIVIRTESRAVKCSPLTPCVPSVKPSDRKATTRGSNSATGRRGSWPPAATDGTVQLWDSSTGKPDRRADEGQRRRSVSSSSAATDTCSPPAYADSTLRLWDTASFQPIGDPMRPASMAYARHSVLTAARSRPAARRHHPTLGRRRPIPQRCAQRSRRRRMTDLEVQPRRSPVAVDQRAITLCGCGPRRLHRMQPRTRCVPS